MIPFFFVVAMIAVTIGMGIWATRKSSTAADFFVAGRSVSVFWNASAISGEYLSAASFMGIAAMVMKNGYDALWYPVGYATGYLFLLLFIAGPLRRFGAYTIPDFAEGRFDSPLFRRIAVTFVLLIGLFYTMPQMKGAGIAMTSILGWPYWAGIVVVGSVITFNVALGGMKGITLVQAFQYWAKLFGFSIPFFVLASVYGGYPSNLGKIGENLSGVPKVEKDTRVQLKGKKDAPANAMSFSKEGTTRLTFPAGAALSKVGVAYPAAGDNYYVQWDPKEIEEDLHLTEGSPFIAAGKTLNFAPIAIGVWDGKTASKDGVTVKTAHKLEFAEPTPVVIGAGSLVPNAQTNRKWIEPFGTLTGKYGFPLLYTYSLIIALVCGTAGLPHILVRFYTNPDGRSAKRTTLLVMVMIGVFYVFTPMWGVLARNVLPALYANNTTDGAVLKLPGTLQNALLGQILTGITSAGAFAAFMSTFSGLLVSMSGAMAHDIYGKILRPNASPSSRLLAFKVAAVGFGGLAMGLGILVESFDINMMVGWAFAIAAASYFPLLLMGAWWRGLTKFGAAAGMLGGGLLSLAAIVTSMLLDKKYLSLEVSPVVRTLLEQPAIWGVPLSITVMVVVSRLTSHAVPADISLKMLRLHAPEEMGFSKNYIGE